MKLKIRTWVAAVALVGLLSPAAALADERVVVDGRLEGYSPDLTLQNSSGPALLWLLVVVLAALVFGVLFMDAKRTHLD
jgi:hypothetical protein